ncbi:MAG: signal peptidase I [Verrucomicrobia bacterium]|nr:signal peptidase I [Verrucomicrobiota bacterium]
MVKLISIVVVAVALAGCAKRTLYMPSSSMEPTIPEGSELTVDFNAYASHSPERFDIIVFRPPDPPGALFAFRVIGLPGETVQLTPEAMLIDGEEVSPPDDLQYSPVSGGINQTNLNSAYFLLGDNTIAARDSRYFGPIERSNIVGKVIKIEQGDASDSSPATGSEPDDR